MLLRRLPCFVGSKRRERLARRANGHTVDMDLTRFPSALVATHETMPSLAAHLFDGCPKMFDSVGMTVSDPGSRSEAVVTSANAICQNAVGLGLTIDSALTPPSNFHRLL